MDTQDALRAGAATCALCGTVIRLGEDAFVTPDFIASESDPDWRFSDAALHRSCFYTWERRKTFTARFNRLARRMVAADGSYPSLTSEGRLIRVASPGGGGTRGSPGVGRTGGKRPS